FLHAVAAPGRPETDHHHLAMQRRQAHRLPVQGRAERIRWGIAGLEAGVGCETAEQCDEGETCPAHVIPLVCIAGRGVSVPDSRRSATDGATPGVWRGSSVPPAAFRT